MRCTSVLRCGCVFIVGPSVGAGQIEAGPARGIEEFIQQPLQSEQSPEHDHVPLRRVVSAGKLTRLCDSSESFRRIHTDASWRCWRVRAGAMLAAYRLEIG